MAAGFSISMGSPRDGSRVVRVVGELDYPASCELDRFLARLVGRVCVDCRGLRFIDARGLGCLIEAAGRLEYLRLLNVPAPVRRVLELTQTTWLLGSDPCQLTMTGKEMSDAQPS